MQSPLLFINICNLGVVMYWYVMHIGMERKINKTDQMILYVQNNFRSAYFYDSLLLISLFCWYSLAMAIARCSFSERSFLSGNFV